jgi:hypothetical protein
MGAAAPPAAAGWAMSPVASAASAPAARTIPPAPLAALAAAGAGAFDCVGFFASDDPSMLHSMS